jgi:type II secretory pathway pseudopilin PulG
MTKKRTARTQVELIAIVMILAAVTMAAVAIPRMSRNSAAAKARACRTNVGMMNTCIEEYYSENSSWPVALMDIAKDSNYFPKGAPSCPAGGYYSIDDITHRASCSVHGH